MTAVTTPRERAGNSPRWSPAGRARTGCGALRVPTLVIHGLDDTLIAPSGGERTAELIPDATLMLVSDMGHDRPEPLWPQLCEAILAHTAERAPSAI